MKPTARDIALQIAKYAFVTGAYYITAKLGLRLALVHPSATAVWPPTGIAFAALLLLGYRAWPAIFVGAFFVNVTVTGSVALAIAIGTGNTLEALVGAYLINRFAHGRSAFDKVDGLFKFTVFAAILSTLISSTIGTTALTVGGFAPVADFGKIWLTWWLGDGVGAMIVAPMALLWFARPLGWWPREQRIEAFALVASIIATGALVFGGFFPSEVQNYPLEFLCLPPLLWAAIRFGQRETTAAVLFLAITAALGTLYGYGPFARPSRQESLNLVQAYAAVASIMTLTLAAIASERRELEARLRDLAVTDPLTGIANYRLLLERLTAEIIRAERTGRRFSVLLCDVDELKKINDQFGHLAGSQLLRRVAEVLRNSSRGTDTPARYGGDEFALVLPEADEAAATLIASRLLERIAADQEKPTIRVSLGVATYPKDGDSAELLLEAADERLYEMKARNRSEVRKLSMS